MIWTSVTVILGWLAWACVFLCIYTHCYIMYSYILCHVLVCMYAALTSISAVLLSHPWWLQAVAAVSLRSVTQLDMYKHRRLRAA